MNRAEIYIKVLKALYSPFLEDGKYLKMPKSKILRFFWLLVFMCMGMAFCLVFFYGQDIIRDYLFKLINKLFRR